MPPTDRSHVFSASPWEPRVGYARAIRVERMVFVSGTTAFDERGDIVGIGDAFAQAMQCFRNIERALTEAGASMRDVVRTRMYVTDITRGEEVGRAHASFFATVRPAATMVEVTRLIDPRMLVEIEVDAVIADPGLE